MHSTLTPEQRTKCERALIDNALKPAKAVYAKGGWWAKPGNNFSQNKDFRAVVLTVPPAEQVSIAVEIRP